MHETPSEMKRAGPTCVVILQLTNTVTVQQSRKRAMQASAGAQIEPQEALLMLNNLPSSHIATVTFDGQWNYCQFGKH